MIQGAANRAVHLRHATQTVSVLDPRIVLRVRRADLAVTQERQEMSSDGLLSRMRTGAMDTRIKRDRSSFERFERHCPGDIGYPRKALRPEEREASDGVHCLGAIEQGEALFGFEIYRTQ